MKFIFSILAIIVFSSVVYGQKTDHKFSVLDSTKKNEQVKASCGTCMFGLSGKDCVLAIRINKKTWLVDNADINTFGDSHATDGFCNAIRKAEVQGEIINDRYKLTYFKFSGPEKKN